MQSASQYDICIASFRAGGPRLRNVFASGVFNAAGWNSVIRVPQNATSRKSRFSGDSATPPTSAVVSSDNSGSLRAHSACAPGINHGMRNARNGHAVCRQLRTSGHCIQTDLAITRGAPRWGLAGYEACTRLTIWNGVSRSALLFYRERTSAAVHRAYLPSATPEASLRQPHPPQQVQVTRIRVN